MPRRDRKVYAAEKKARERESRKRAAALANVRRLLDVFPCPVCGRRAKADEWLRVGRHEVEGVKCAGSLLVIGWFDDGLAAIPENRRQEPGSKVARARLVRHMGVRSGADSARRSTSVIGDVPGRHGPDVSGGLPGSARRH